MQETQEEEEGMELRDRGNQEVGQCEEGSFCSHCHHCQDLLYKEQEEDPDYGEEDDPDYSGGEDEEEEVDDSEGDSDEEEDDEEEVDVPETRGRGRPLKPFAELKPWARSKVTQEIKENIEKLVKERGDVRYQSSGISIA